jgi:hypothetical protein
MKQSAVAVRSTTWCALLGYAVIALGLPLPFGSLPADRGDAGIDPAAALLLAAKDRSRPFPCMNKPCGCASAEQCFTNCCCHSPAERLAWARARGCEASVRAALARAATLRPEPRPEKAASCCAAKAACSAAKAEQPAPAPAAGRGRSVTVRAMLACSGIVEQWFAASTALPPARVEPPRPHPCLQRVIVADARDDSLRAVPDVPPPRAL